MAESNCFSCEGRYIPLGTCLHVPKGISVTVEADKDSEVLVQSAVNETVFDSVLYTPKTCKAKIFGLGQFEGKAQRTVRTFFDVHNAPSVSYTHLRAHETR